MLYDTNRALEKVADYTKLSDGTWAVEVRALNLRATGTTPTECKIELVMQFDKRLAAWLLQVAKGDPNSEPLIPNRF